jgi:hypothetical protein
MFYIQLLRPQIPKELKNTDDLTVFFTLWGSGHAKAARRMLVKLTPENTSTFQTKSLCDPFLPQLVANSKKTFFLIFAVNIACLLHIEKFH